MVHRSSGGAFLQLASRRLLPRLPGLPPLAVASAAAVLLASLAGAAGGASLVQSRTHVDRSAAVGSGRPYALVGARSLRLREHVTDIAADGGWVAVSSGDRAGLPAGCNVSFWRPQVGQSPPFYRVPPLAVGNCDASLSTYRWGSLAFAGSRAAWVALSGGIGRFQSLITASSTRGAQDGGYVASAGGCCLGLDPWEGTHLGDVVGRGKLLVFTTWTAKCISPCPTGATLTSQAIWRFGDGIGDCAADPNHIPRSPHCVAIAEANGPLKPLAVDGGRIVILRGERSVELWDAAGHALRVFEFTAEQPLAAVLSGRSLSVLIQGRLETFDTETGALLHSWSLPDVPSGGPCRSVGERCPSVRLVLRAAAGGLVLYVFDRAAHLLRLSDGRDVSVTRAAAADLTAKGLFYASAFGGLYRGRVRFIPIAELPLRAN